MHIKSLFAITTLAVGAFASPTFDLGNDKKVPGYPRGPGKCLIDDQANFIVAKFKSILTNPDRNAAGATAQILLSEQYSESSDSINVLAGRPQGSVSFNSKTAFIDGVTAQRAIIMEDLDVFHDCDKILWQWIGSRIGLDVSPVKGMDKFIVDTKTGIIKSADIEFNNIAWGRNIGWTCTPPPQ